MPSYSWRIARQDDFYRIYSLIYNSDKKPMWGIDEIRRRVIIPLFLEQFIVFHHEHGDEERLSGFLTFALMNGESACHQSTIGVLPQDWRSGPQVWVVDLFCPFGEGTKMITAIRKDVASAISEPLHYFRVKRSCVRKMSMNGGSQCRAVAQ